MITVSHLLVAAQSKGRPGRTEKLEADEFPHCRDCAGTRRGISRPKASREGPRQESQIYAIRKQGRVVWQPWGWKVRVKSICGYVEDNIPTARTLLNWKSLLSPVRDAAAGSRWEIYRDAGANSWLRVGMVGGNRQAIPLAAPPSTTGTQVFASRYSRVILVF